MPALGNWEIQAPEDEIKMDWGRVSIFGRDNSSLEISFTENGDEEWQQIHSFPPASGEVFTLELPTTTLVRVVSSGTPKEWAWSKFNNPSG